MKQNKTFLLSNNNKQKEKNMIDRIRDETEYIYTRNKDEELWKKRA